MNLKFKKCTSHDQAIPLLSLSARETLESVVSLGTGKNAYIENYRVGGKTGTAQTGWFVDGENYQHAWFTGFFPAEKPKYAMCVFVENGKSGSGVAAPLFGKIAKEIMKAD